MGLFDKIINVFKSDKNKHEDVKNYDEGLKKARGEFVSKLSNLSLKYKNISEDYFEELENILIMADIGVNTVMNFVDLLKDRVKKEKIIKKIHKITNNITSERRFLSEDDKLFFQNDDILLAAMFSYARS